MECAGKEIGLKPAKKQKGGFAMKEVEALDKVIKFVEMKLEACGSFKDGPEGAALKSVMEYAFKLREAK